MQRLGYTKYVAQGGDWGNAVIGSDGPAAATGIARHSHQHGGDGSARCFQSACRRRPAAGRPFARRKARVGPTRLTSTRTAWATPTRCRSVRRRCMGSPIRQSVLRAGSSITTFAATQMIARVFDGKPEGLTRDDVLDNITLYWLTNTAISRRVFTGTRSIISRREASSTREASSFRSA